MVAAVQSSSSSKYTAMGSGLAGEPELISSHCLALISAPAADFHERA